jgi:hypothetical protein
VTGLGRVGSSAGRDAFCHHVPAHISYQSKKELKKYNFNRTWVANISDMHSRE